MMLAMPAVDTSSVPDEVIARHVREAYKEVEAEPPLKEERNTGIVPVFVHDTTDYGGVTHIDPIYRDSRLIDVESRLVGISKYVPRRQIKKIAKHEFRHVKSEKLLKYADVPQLVATIIMESYAEYEGIKSAKERGRKDEAHEIERTTPYRGAVRLAGMIDNYHVSDIDGRVGYRAFIRDIINKKSMAKAIERFKYCKKLSMN